MIAANANPTASHKDSREILDFHRMRVMDSQWNWSLPAWGVGVGVGKSYSLSWLEQKKCQQFVGLFFLCKSTANSLSPCS
jgi:hypothetical protein